MAANGDGQNIPLPPGDDDFEEDEAGGQHENAVPPPPPAGANQQPPFHQQPPPPPPGGQPHVGAAPPYQFNPYAPNFIPPWFNPFGQWHMPHPNFQHAGAANVGAGHQQTPQPHKVKLASFWPNKPKVWFTTAEAEFDTYYVQDSRARFNLVLKALPDEAMERAAAIVENPEQCQDPYGALKARLLEAYQMDPWEASSRLLHFRELGEMKPSQMMDSMLALHHPDHLFKAVFLQRLPSDMRDHVQREATRLDCRELAAFADSIWQSRNASRANVLAALPLPPAPDSATEELADAVAAVKLSGGKKNFQKGGKRWSSSNSKRQPRQGGQKDQSDKKGGSVCWRHLKFREKAWGCEDPACYLFPGN